jgi:spore coat polysaccharide biosynthesis protein SpsF
MTSTRLLGKVMLPIAGRPMLLRVLDRACSISNVDVVCVAVPEGPAHDPVAVLAREKEDVVVVRGPEQDVLKRYAIAARALGAETVVRVTSDCPLLDPAVSAAVIAAYRSAGATLARTALTSGFPHGFDTEVIAANLLYEADREAKESDEREHVTAFFWKRPERYPAIFLDRLPDRHMWRLTVDTPADLELADAIYRQLGSADPLFGLAAIERLFSEDTKLLALANRLQPALRQMTAQ